MRVKFVILPALVFVLLALSGCGNTIEGVERDLDEWGQTIDDNF